MSLTIETKTNTFTAADFRQRALAHAIPLERAAEVGAALYFHGDHDLNPDLPTASISNEALRLAAVLVPVVDYGDQASIILTKRAAHLSAHAGQIAFPGGKVNESDTNVIDAAIRETVEEIGLASDFIEPLGLLNAYRTGTGFCVIPVLSVVSPGFTLTVDKQEVADVFEVPLGFLMSPDNHQRHSREFHGKIRHFHAMPYRDRYIWGATAGILLAMYERLYAE